MNYKGIELKEFASDEPIIFDPPKTMFVWDNGIVDSPSLATAMAYIPGRFYPVIGAATVYQHCAEIPEELKFRRATNLELMKWLAQGNGYCTNVAGSGVWAAAGFDSDIADRPCHENFRVRKWDDSEWHEPTVDYIGLED